MLKKILRCAAYLCLLLICLLPWQAVHAHGGGELQISNAPVGDYRVSVWSNPPTARAGQAVHITVGVARAGNGEPVLDAAVSVSVVDNSGQTLAMAPATTEQSVNRLFYEADLDGLPIGEYEVQIEVEGNQGNGGLAFPLSVESTPTWLWLVGAAVALAFIWLVLRTWRKAARDTSSARDTAVSRHRSVD